MTLSQLLRLCFLVIPLSVFLSSCVFNSDEQYFNDLTKPDAKDITGSINTVDLKDYSPGDTITIYGSTIFNLYLSGEYGDIVSGSVYLNKNFLTNCDGYSFSIPKYSISDGIYPLTLQLVTTSGSGSLADLVGTEKLNITMKWVIKVDLSPPPQPLAKLDIVNGFLTMQWPAYTKPNFQSYFVRRKLSSGASKTFEIKDKKITSWKDESYVGLSTAPIEYSVAIVTETGTAASVPISRVDPLAYKFSYSSPDSTFTFKWKPTKFYGPYNGYKFDIEDKTTVFSNITDSTYSGKLSQMRFGGNSVIRFTVQSKSADLPEYWVASVFKPGSTFNFTANGEIKFNAYRNSFIALDTQNKLVELNDHLQPITTLATLTGADWQMPYPGNYVFNTATSYLDYNIYRVRLSDNSQATYNYSYFRSQGGSFSVAGTGLICIDYDRPVIQYVTKALDPADGSTAFSEVSSTVRLSAVISEDGRFIWANNNRVFKISGSTFQLVGSFSGSGSFFGFRKDNSNEMMFQEGSAIKIYDANTFTLLRTINAPAYNVSFYGDYDVKTKNMLWKSSSSSYYAYAVHIETGAVKAIPIHVQTIPTKLFLSGGLLIHDGYYIQLK